MKAQKETSRILSFRKQAMFLTLVTCIGLSIQVFAAGGDGTNSGGGGGACDDRVQEIRDDLRHWIEGQGPEKGKLKLLGQKTIPEYSKAMADYLAVSRDVNGASTAKTRVECVYHVIQFQGDQRDCRFDQLKSGPKITCDARNFLALNEDRQYRIIHHEYAGLAGFEPPHAGQSTYFVSDQISAYLEKQVIKKLAIKSLDVPQTEVERNLAKIFTVAQIPVDFETAVAQKFQTFLKDAGFEKLDVTLERALPFDYFAVESVAHKEFSYCLDPTTVWNHPYTSHYKHLDEPVCQKFQPEYYKNNPTVLKKTYHGPSWTDGFRRDEDGYVLHRSWAEMFREGGDSYKANELYASLPEVYVDHVRDEFGSAFSKNLIPLAEKVKSGAEEVSKDKTLSHMETCAAVALIQISSPLASLNSDPNHLSDYEEYIRQTAIYKARLRYLTYTISDWVAKTGGNSDLCPNFGLELQVNELYGRLEGAEARAEANMKQLRKEMRFKGQVTTAEILALGFAGYVHLK